MYQKEVLRVTKERGITAVEEESSRVSTLLVPSGLLRGWADRDLLEPELLRWGIRALRDPGSCR